MVKIDNFRSSNSPAGSPFANLVFKNGKIYTVNPDQPWVEAVAIRHGHFAYVGANDGVDQFVDDKTIVVDLEGKFAMPGLYDMHTHPDLALAPKYQGRLDVGIQDPTPEQVKNAILAYTNKVSITEENEGWIHGQSWVRYTFTKAGLTPGKEWLDSFMPDRPVAILDRMWGTMMANSKALELAGIDASTPDPRNGYIDRDPITGEPTGLLIDGGYAMVHAAMPPESQEVLRRSYGDGARYQTSRGVVGTKYVHVCEHRLDALKSLDDAGELSLRVEAAISWQDDIFPVARRWELLSGERHYYRSNRLNANAVKFHFDGTVEPQSSYLLTSWEEGNEWRGKLNLTPDHIADMLIDMDRRRIRVIAHCTGDGASDVFLDAVEKTRKVNGPVTAQNGMRHQCAHSTILDNNNLKRFKELDVVAEFSPVSWYPSPFVSGARSGYGKERLERAYNFKGVIEEGGVAVLGTDWPVSFIDPWVGFESLVTRKNPWKEYEGTFGQSIPLEEAIKVMTINGAWSMGLEEEAGSIEVGKSADMIVLDKNLFEVEPQGNIYNTEVELTVLEGQLTHDLHGYFDATDQAAIWSGKPINLLD